MNGPARLSDLANRRGLMEAAEWGGQFPGHYHAADFDARPALKRAWLLAARRRARWVEVNVETREGAFRERYATCWHVCRQFGFRSTTTGTDPMSRDPWVQTLDAAQALEVTRKVRGRHDAAVLALAKEAAGTTAGLQIVSKAKQLEKVADQLRAAIDVLWYFYGLHEDGTHRGFIAWPDEARPVSPSGSPGTSTP